MIDRSAFPPGMSSESHRGDASDSPASLFTWNSATKWFQLPSSFQGYLIFLLCLLILAFTMVLHVTLSAEILRLNVELDGLASENERIERHNANLVWLISQRSSLTDAYKAARELEYAPVTDVQFVVRTDEELQGVDQEPFVSQLAVTVPGDAPWWQEVWGWTQHRFGAARDWVRARTGW
jgi:hypothetical protein